MTGELERQSVEESLHEGTRGDVLDPLAGLLDAALAQHQRELDPKELVEHERRMAETFATAAERAGVERIVYLGATAPQGPPSDHLLSRLVAGRALRNGHVPTLELRAGMIVTTGSYCGVLDVPLDTPLTFTYGDLGTLAMTLTRAA